jgi:hypothetical protein
MIFVKNQLQIHIYKEQIQLLEEIFKIFKINKELSPDNLHINNVIPDKQKLLSEIETDKIPDIEAKIAILEKEIAKIPKNATPEAPQTPITPGNEIFNENNFQENNLANFTPKQKRESNTKLPKPENWSCVECRLYVKVELVLVCFHFIKW